MGAIQSGISQAFPPSAKWGVSDIPDLTGRVVIVTGGYAGIGTWTVKVSGMLKMLHVVLTDSLQALLDHNAKVYIAGRDESKGSKTIGELKAQTSKQAHFLKLDLGNLKSIKAAAEELASKEPAVHILFNNAYVPM
jgi:retinol dehydrogenase-12